MSTTDTQVVPAGTWSGDKVHSNVGFAIDYLAGTFQGSFSDVDASLEDGVLRGAARSQSVQVKDAQPRGASPGAGLLRCRASPGDTF